ncbi:hypothetical protein [Magnetococcus sp. PR-3]
MRPGVGNRPLYAQVATHPATAHEWGDKALDAHGPDPDQLEAS